MKFPYKLALGALLNQLFGLGLGQLSIVDGLHGVVTTALSLGTQVGSIAEHLSQRHVGIDLDSTGTGDLTQNVAAACGDIANDGTHILSGTVTETFMMGSRMAGLAFLQASLNAMEPAILNAISEESTSW